jgi:hypothetical protein
MHRDLVRLLQKKLADAGLYQDDIDGDIGPNTGKAAHAALAAQPARPLPGWEGWTDKRKLIAFLQMQATDAGIAAGKIDGQWGQLTDFAASSLMTLDRTGSLPPDWRDRELRPRPNPNRWPKETPATLNETFGPHGLPDGGRSPAMVIVDVPWSLKIAWDPRQKTRRIACNAKVAESLGKVLTRVHETYGDEELKALGLDLFGGCYNPRKKRGGSSMSTHAWAIALDWDPDRNKLEWNHAQARMARPEYEEWWKAWEDEGWLSLGREKNFDWMHVQATV